MRPFEEHRDVESGSYEHSETKYSEKCAFRGTPNCATGEIRSTNFQLHPPRGKDTDLIRNTCGNLLYPLYFCAERASGGKYQVLRFAPEERKSGKCVKSDERE